MILFSKKWFSELLGYETVCLFRVSLPALANAHVLALLFSRFSVEKYCEKIHCSRTTVDKEQFPFQMYTKRGAWIRVERSGYMRPPSLHSERVRACMRHDAHAHICIHAHKHSHHRANDSAVHSLVQIVRAPTQINEHTLASLGCGALAYTTTTHTHTQWHPWGVVSCEWPNFT